MHSVEQALAALGRVDATLGEDARAAWETLTGGEGPEVLTQWRLQQFCWEELARGWPEDGASRWRIALALAALLDELGLQRYAVIARSDTTRQVLIGGEQAPDRGRVLARKAAQRSGIEPPNTEFVTWGAVMEPAEAYALESVADRLELAVATGDLLPGSRGWRDAQAEITVQAGWETAVTSVLAGLIFLVFVLGIIRTVRRHRRPTAAERTDAPSPDAPTPDAPAPGAPESDAAARAHD